MFNLTFIRRVFLFTLLLISPILIGSLSFAGTPDANLKHLLDSGGSGNSGQFYRIVVTFKKQLNAKTFLTMQRQATLLPGKFSSFLANLQARGQVQNVERLWLANAVSMQITLSEIANVLKQPTVAAVELDELRRFIPEPSDSDGTPTDYSPNDTEAPYGIILTRLREANGKGFIGKGIEVAVIDTGADYWHKAFDHNQIDEKNATGFVEGQEGDWRDGHGHGTHVSGTVATKRYGGAPGTIIMPVRVLNAQGSGTFAGIIKGIQHAVTHGARVVNMSLGGPAGTGFAVNRAVINGIKGGVFFAIAAGNEGLDGKPNIGSPGDTEEACTAGACDRNGNPAPFQSHGPTLDNKPKPDLMPPGVKVLSALPGDKEAEWSGTSMGTPHISALAAVIIEAMERNKGTKATPEAVKRVLMQTAAGKKIPNITGAGIPDCVAALDLALKK